MKLWIEVELPQRGAGAPRQRILAGPQPWDMTPAHIVQRRQKKLQPETPMTPDVGDAESDKWESLFATVDEEPEEIDEDQQGQDRGDSGLPVRLGPIAPFGSNTSRLSIYPRLRAISKACGTTDFGNGRVLSSSSVDPLWGLSSFSPDYLNKAGAFKAAPPGEHGKRRIYMEVEKPNLSALWSKSALARLPPPQPSAYEDHVASDPDPYNVCTTWETARKQGNMAASLSRQSGTFESERTRACAKEQTNFERYWYNHKPGECSGKMPSDKCQEDTLGLGNVSGSNSRPGTARSVEWSKMGERFSRNISFHTFQAVSKAQPPVAPPPTRYNPSAPLTPTVQEAARPEPSQRPGIRGGLYRESTAGTGAFLSRSLRPGQARQDHTSVRRQSAGGSHRDRGLLSVPRQITSDEPCCRSQTTSPVGASVQPPHRQQTVSPSAQGAIVDGLITSWDRRRRRADHFAERLRGEPMVTENMLDKWRSLMW